MFDTLKRLILPDTSLHCPRCDKSLEGHDEAACARRMSRRFFFQVAAGAAVVVAVPGQLAIPEPVVVAEPVRGLFLRHIREYDVLKGEMMSRLDVLYGLGDIKPGDVRLGKGGATHSKIVSWRDSEVTKEQAIDALVKEIPAGATAVRLEHPIAAGYSQIIQVRHA